MFEHEYHEEVLRLLREALHELRVLNKRHPVSSTLSFKTDKGETNMPLTVHINDKPGTAVYQEWSGLGGTGIKVNPTGAVVYKSDNPAVATVDPATGLLAYLSAGSTNISADDGGNLPASDVLTVSAAVAASSTMTLNPGQ